MNKDALTVDEVSEMLQIGRNAVYKLAKEGVLGSYKIGRKLRFTYSDVQSYIESLHRPTRQGAKSMATPPVMGEGERKDKFIICGQTPVLDVLSAYLEKEGVNSVRTYAGSYDSLMLLYKKQVTVAETHLWDGDLDEYNISFARKLLPGLPIVIIRLMSRMEGYVVASGNPKKITSWDDLGRQDIAMINQKRGCGARILLDEHLRVRRIDPKDVRGYDNEANVRVIAASAVARGKADYLIETEKIARQVDGVEFIPLQEEHVDLVMLRSDFETASGQKLMDLLESNVLRDDFAGINGYDLTNMGRIICID